MPPPGTPIPMMLNQITPQLNSMYSQESLPAHAQAQAQVQRGAFAQPYQQPSGVHSPDEQMPAQQQQQQQFYPDVASMSGYGGAHPSVTPSEYDFATASQQPQQQPQQQQYPQQPFTPQPATTAWEQQNVYEVPPQQPQQTQPQPTDPTLRSLELTQARQRISALEAAREQQDTQLALQISAQEAEGQLAEREEREVHETLLRSLDSYERDLRRGLDGGGEAGDDWYGEFEDVHEEDFPVTDAFEGMSATTAATEVGTATTTSRTANRDHAHNNRSTASTPIPISTNPAHHHPTNPVPPIHPGIPSQVASLSNTSIVPPPVISSSSPTPKPTPSSSRHPQQQHQQNNPVEQSWTSPTPRPYTPTPGAAPSSAAWNREDEEARRWRAFRAQQQARPEAGSVRTDEISSLGVGSLLGGSESTVEKRKWKGKGKGKERARD